MVKKVITDALSDFVCCCTFGIMDDPVILSDGHSYERSFITVWLRTYNTSPKTGAVLVNKNIIPNHTLKGTIEEFKNEIYVKKLNKQIGELEKRAENGDSCATNKLGLMYKDGIGLVVQNYDKAREYFERAKQLGNQEATIYLAKLYSEDRKSVVQDYEKAIQSVQTVQSVQSRRSGTTNALVDLMHRDDQVLRMH